MDTRRVLTHNLSSVAQIARMFSLELRNYTFDRSRQALSNYQKEISEVLNKRRAIRFPILNKVNVFELTSTITSFLSVTMLIIITTIYCKLQQPSNFTDQA